MTGLFIFLTVILIAALALAKSCGDFDGFLATTRASFWPRSWKEFAFPRCAFCWVARAALAGIVATIYFA